MRRAVKLVKINDELYRTESGSHHIMRNIGDDKRENKWTVSYIDFFSCKVTRNFPTLAKVKEFIKGN